MTDALVGLLSVAVAIIALGIETRRSRISQQADIIIRLAERFKDPAMRELRRTAANKLIQRSATNDELSDVLDFFCILATLVKAGAFNLAFAYSAFDYWVSRYWQCAQEHVAMERKYDPDTRQSLDWLVRKFAKISRRSRIPVIFSTEVLEKFLREEAQREGDQATQQADKAALGSAEEPPDTTSHG